MGSMGARMRRAGMVGAAIGAFCCSSVASAQSVPATDYHIPSQDLGRALSTLARESGLQLVADGDLIEGKRSSPVNGHLSPQEAVQQALEGTGLSAIISGNTIVIRGRSEPPQTEVTDAAAPSSDIVVTGTNIHGARPVGSSLITLDRQDIDRSGYATTQQILRSLPQNFGGGPSETSFGLGSRNGEDTNQALGASVNLRGLGSSSTLVLVNGNRLAIGGLYGSFADISLIPASAIERIEVLADGSSALYGSDAVAGVVNIRLRDRFEGAETRARFAAADGFHEWQTSQLLGKNWSSGHVLAAYEYYRRGNLPAADRPYATEDLRAFGGPDYRTDFANPGTVHVGNDVWAIPANQDGTGLAPDDLAAGKTNLADGRAHADLLPAQTRHTGYVSLAQDVTNRLRFTLQGLVADRTSRLRITPVNAGWVVPASNPFYVDPSGTNSPVIVDYDFTPDLGPTTVKSHVRGYNAAAGLDWALGNWSIGARGVFGQQDEAIDEINVVNYVNIASALADPDPATAFNLFGDGSHTTPATIDKVRGFYSERGRYRLWSGNLKADGPLFQLPGGAARLALGGEYRIEQYALTSINDLSTPVPTQNGVEGLPITRHITAGFAELLLPIVGGDFTLPGINKLTLSLAGRIEHYDDFGTTSNPKVGLDWQPLRGLTLRGSFGTSFRAPGFQVVRLGPGNSLYMPVPVADPQAPGGTTNALFLFGNAPGTGPEKARTWTISAEIRPVTLPGVHLVLDYFNVDYRDRIQNISANYPIFLENRSEYGSLIDDRPTTAAIASYYGDINFQNPYGIAASEIGAIVDARTKNLARVREDGLDFDLGYQGKLARHAVDLGIAGSAIFHVNRQIAPGAPVVDIVNRFGSPVSLRLRGHATVTFGRLDATAFVNFIGGYRNDSVVPSQHVGSWTTTDLTLAWRLPVEHGPLSGTRLSFSATNLFDRAPPYVQNRTLTSAIGYDASNASPVGRMVAFEVVKSW